MPEIKKQTVNISLEDLNNAKRSVAQRLVRLRQNRKWCPRKTPIEKLGCFDTEIQVMENTLRIMENRLDNATITVTL